MEFRRWGKLQGMITNAWDTVPEVQRFSQWDRFILRTLGRLSFNVAGSYRWRPLSFHYDYRSLRELVLNWRFKKTDIEEVRFDEFLIEAWMPPGSKPVHLILELYQREMAPFSGGFPTGGRMESSSN